MPGGITACEFEYVRNITVGYNFNICMHAEFFARETNQLCGRNISVCVRVADHILVFTE
jgi:hypothetical protein